MIKCKTCEEEFDPEWRVSVGYPNANTLPEVWESKNFCPRCFFWWMMVKARTNGNVTDEGNKCVVVGGQHYRICDENSESLFRGYGGAKFIIDFFDGSTVTTTNLWHDGEVPEVFREHLPNNATFRKQYE